MSPLGHAIAQIEHVSGDDEAAITAMVKSLLLLPVDVDPEPFGLQDEKVAFVGKTVIGDPAFDIGEAIHEEGWLNTAGRHRCQAEPSELVDFISRAVADVDDGFRQIDGRDGNHAFPGCPQRLVAVVPGTDDGADQRRDMLDHHVKAHRHDVGRSVHLGRHENDRTRFEQTISARGSKFLHDAPLDLTQRLNAKATSELRSIVMWYFMEGMPPFNADALLACMAEPVRKAVDELSAILARSSKRV